MTPTEYTILYDNHAAELCFFANKLLKDKQEAEDVVSSVFMKVWEQLDKWKCHRNILYMMVKNACIDRIRLRQKYKITDLPEDLEQEVEHAAIETDYMKRVYELMQDFPKRQREIFIRTYFNDQTSTEISKAMGVTVSTVTTQRQRSINLLRSKIKTNKN